MKENEFISDFEDIYGKEFDDELVCPRCGSNDLQNFGGCFICNECGLRENLI